MLASVSLRKVKRRMDPRYYNGGMFLGLNGICVKSHGGMDKIGFAQAIIVAANLVERDYNSRVALEVQQLMDQAPSSRRCRWRIAREDESMIRSLGHHACGSYLPRTIVTNAELATRVDTSDEWIVQRTGIRERRIAGADEPTSLLAIEAARDAMARGGYAPGDIDGVIVATSTPDTTFPAVAARVQAALGLPHGFAMDVQAVCSGFIYALTTADSLAARRAGETPAGHRRGEIFEHPRLERPHDLRPLRRRRRRGGAGGARRAATARWRIAASSPRTSMPTARWPTSSTPAAARRRPAMPASSSWRARRFSSTPCA